MNTFSLTPLFRHSVGFDRLDNMMTRVFDNEKKSPSYPPYNIEKINDDQYRITMAIAGFKLENVKIMVHGDLLTVNGEHSKEVANEAPNKEITYLYKGIANRSFNRKFNLADHVKVVSAKMEDGILQIELTREIPDEAKPRTIEISQD
ncbi:MAG: heat-shock protein [Gammaproteobacteria bacterium]|nr:MAG: heat-shock protein [Gammaproteobacteria bacterium]